MASGVKVVGASVAPAPAHEHSDEQAEAPERIAPGGLAAAPVSRPEAARRGGARRRVGVVVLGALAVLGLAGTVGFGLAWAGLHSRLSGETQARSAARSFVVDLTNFDAKTVDADFRAITSMATGPFSSQAQKFFNSAIRQDLQRALASSRGQIRSMYVQSYGTGQATVYAVVDQLYVNDKITTPQTDVLRLVVTMSQVAGRWKVADVTVLQGPALSSGSARSAHGG
jgi:hypothetical protein